jgi:NADH-quinone oxidoreductase subunit N
MFILILTFFCLGLSLGYFRDKMVAVFEFPLLMLLATLGMFIVISANDFFVLFLGMEIQSLVFYILSGLKRYSNLSIEASLKYFIFGSFASCIMLLGISFIYGFFGTLDFNEIYKTSIFDFTSSQLDNVYLLFGIFLVLVSLFFKMAIFPFHY